MCLISSPGQPSTNCRQSDWLYPNTSHSESETGVDEGDPSDAVSKRAVEVGGSNETALSVINMGVTCERTLFAVTATVESVVVLPILPATVAPDDRAFLAPVVVEELNNGAGRVDGGWLSFKSAVDVGGVVEVGTHSTSSLELPSMLEVSTKVPGVESLRIGTRV